MLPISKGNPPQELLDAIRRLKATDNATLNWDNIDSKGHQAARASLLREQGGLCAYCMRKITFDTAHVEHYIPQSAGAGGDNPSSVDYNNMLAVCDGFKGSGRGLTCDRARGNVSMTVNPLRPETLTSIRYNRNGVITASDETIKHDLVNVLNLNQSLLVRNRKAAYLAMCRQLDRIGKRNNSHAVARFCRNYVDEHLSNPSKRVAYDGIVIYFMRKRLRAE